MQNDVAQAFRKHRVAFGLVLLFSVAVNLIALSGAVFTHAIYDRVLSGQSLRTLGVLFALVTALYAIMAVLDIVRARIAIRVAAQLQSDLDPLVLRASLDGPSHPAREVASAVGDVDALRAFVGSPAGLATVDLPFAPVCLALLFAVHPGMGWLTAGAATGFVALLGVYRTYGSRLSDGVRTGRQRAARLAGQISVQQGSLHALRMTSAAAALWQDAREETLAGEVALSSQIADLSALARALRLFLQAAILALGALLALRGEITPGTMIAGSILSGRALAPLEQLAGGWSLARRALTGLASLSSVLAPPRAASSAAHLPRHPLAVEVVDLTVIPPGGTRPALQGISFAVRPGQALGVIGPVGAGKSALAHVLTGAWQPTTGKVRIAAVRGNPRREHGSGATIGYVPQTVSLFAGSVSQNIARLAPHPDLDAVIRAAKLAGIHGMIQSLPSGYDTHIGPDGSGLSGGQRQAVALARAVFGDPQIVVLDEPASNLDAEGADRLNTAIRRMVAAGQTVIVMSHRPAAIAACEQVLMLRDGQVAASGPRDPVLRQVAAYDVSVVPARASARSDP
jgi:ATP-binding cassette subfamily C protein